ncbi:Glucosaminyl phosphatidylinositol (GlcN-PI) nositol acylation protein [Leucoagaricus gongylophorus]
MDYHQRKIDFVSHGQGSSVLHVNTIAVIAPASVLLFLRLQPRHLLIQWTLLVLPLVLVLTLFPTCPLFLAALLIIPALLVPRRPLTLPSHASPRPRLPALSVYRAHMLLITVLAILAVDFPLFPRFLAKSESFGVSLVCAPKNYSAHTLSPTPQMDLGVGSFVFSQGIVSAIPLLSSPSSLLKSSSSNLYKSLRKSLPLFFLGFIRLALLKVTHYPEHVTEYGVHWNFFFTLASIPLLQLLLHPLLASYSPSLIGIALALVQQLLLSTTLQSLVLSPTRTHPSSLLLSLFYQNKEGLSSLLGYLSIHILGLSLGTTVLPPSPNFFPKFQLALRKSTNLPSIPSHNRKTHKTALHLTNGMIFLSSSAPQPYSLQVNLSYILWVAAFNVSFFLIYLILLDTVNINATDNTPPLLAAMNRQGLVVFLLANGMTGLVNLSVDTMEVGDIMAMGVLVVYSWVLSALVWWWDGG